MKLGGLVVFSICLYFVSCKPCGNDVETPCRVEKLSPAAWTPYSAGWNVVKMVTDSVETTLGGTNDLLIKIAVVESNTGRDPGTFRRGYYGGIYQVDLVAYESTKDIRSHPRLILQYKKIEREYGIHWPSTHWQDCVVPIYSALAARLYLLNIPAPIPKDLRGQAIYWKKYYNTEAGAGTAQQFIDRWNHYTPNF